MRVLNLVWVKSPATLRLEQDEVHVWRAALNLPSVSFHRMCGFLAPDELDRMNRFYFFKDRVRFAAGRGILRAILSRYTGKLPEQIRFSYGFHGKPFLAEPQPGDAQSLNFNLSHSGDLALIAVASSRKVGVDVERLRSETVYERLARRFFTPSEQSALFALPPGLQFYAFYAIWTRKEAYLKAMGVGLSQPLDGFEVDLTSVQGVGIVGRSQIHNRADGWSFVQLTPGPSYVAALAVSGRDWNLSCWEWE